MGPKKDIEIYNIMKRKRVEYEVCGGGYVFLFRMPHERGEKSFAPKTPYALLPSLSPLQRFLLSATFRKLSSSNNIFSNFFTMV